MSTRSTGSIARSRTWPARARLRSSVDRLRESRRLPDRGLTAHAFRFGLSATRARPAQEWLALARRLEGLGYHSLLMPDHFGARFSIAPALVLAAHASERLRVGSLVYDNDFRHPAVLAQEVATIDTLTEGRFDFGIGAGWLKTEYDATGIGFDAGLTRVERLAESIELIKLLLSGEKVSFSGRYYQLRQASAGFQTVQRPHPPIAIGGGGRRLLALAAKAAQIISVMPRSRADGSGLMDADALVSAFEEKVAWIREAAGARFDEIELNTLVQLVQLTDNPTAEAERLAGQWPLRPSDLLASPLLLVGPAQAIAEKLIAQRDRLGISYIAVFEKDLEAFSGVIAAMRHLKISAG